MPRETEVNLGKERWQDAVLRLEEDVAKMSNTVEEVRQTIDFLEQKVNALVTQVGQHRGSIEQMEKELFGFRQKFKRYT